MRGGFVHLHVHSQYSLLDGACRIPDLVGEAGRLGMPAVALTDHGALYGIVEFYKEARRQGIRPILGCELYVAPRGRHDKSGGPAEAADHLLVLAEDGEGYQNLLRLSSLGFLEGFYYKPRVDKELLARHSKGLICLTGCLAGEVASAAMAGDAHKALAATGELAEIFGRDRVYVELQENGVTGQTAANRVLVEVARRLSLPLIATNDVHYVRPEDARAHEVLLCIQTGKSLEDPDRLRFETDQFYLRSAEEMRQLFAEVPEACDHTLEVAERCQVELQLGRPELPRFEVPGGESPEAYLRRLTLDGAQRRYGAELSPQVRERLDHELAIIERTGFSGYFLVVADFVNHARSSGIPVGPGRGSAAGSLVAYCLGITSIDPLAHGLIFERFLNPERVSMPDIDIDFADDRRDEVIEYVVRRYGADRVAQIATFGTMAARAAIRDTGRVLGIPYAQVDRVAKLVPSGPGVTLDQALAEPDSRLGALYRSDSKVRKWIDLARALEGSPRHVSVHAAGVVIAARPVVEKAPLARTSEGVVVTQFPMESLEEVGLLKMDFLGLRNLTVLRRATELIAEHRGVRVDLENLPGGLSDREVYAMLSRGETAGVFQLETSMFQGLLREMRPERFSDLVAALALGRPGPMERLSEYIRRRHGAEPVRYAHPDLEPILRETYGVIIYQEQVMRIASELAGYSMGQADLLRRAMGKKKPEEMEAQRARFFEGMASRGYPAELAESLFGEFERFAQYAFNVAHSAAYALISYQTAWLRCRYPVEFMAALLTSVSGNTDRVAQYLDACRQMGIRVLGPDVNVSGPDFTPVPHSASIRFGLAAIKHVGYQAVQEVVRARAEGGPFRSLADFCSRIDSRHLNRKMLESLVKAGAFDGVYGGPSARPRLLDQLDATLAASRRRQGPKTQGQRSLLAMEPALPQAQTPLEEPPAPGGPDGPAGDQAPPSLRELLAMERETLGLYISAHPFSPWKARLAPVVSFRLAEAEAAGEGSFALVGGVVAEVKAIRTRSGQPMRFVTLEDDSGSLEVVVYPRLVAALDQAMAQAAPEGQALLVWGELRHDDRDGRPKLAAEGLFPAARLVRVAIDPATVPASALGRLRQAFKRHSGDSPVVVEVNRAGGGWRAVLLLREEDWVTPGEDLAHSLRSAVPGEIALVAEGAGAGEGMGSG